MLTVCDVLCDSVLSVRIHPVAVSFVKLVMLLCTTRGALDAVKRVKELRVGYLRVISLTCVKEDQLTLINTELNGAYSTLVELGFIQVGVDPSPEEVKVLLTLLVSLRHLRFQGDVDLDHIEAI